MKAWIVECSEGIDAMKLVEYKPTDLESHHLRIRIKACGLNNRDIFIAEGKYYRPITLPCILGSDIAGEVIEVGANVTQFSVGSRVLIYPIIGCGSCEKCADGLDNECATYDSMLGGLASEVVVNASQCVVLPDYFTYEDAAAMPIAYLTAWNMLYSKAKVKGYETILFWGATSGVGTAGLLLFNKPAQSILVVGSEEKANLLRAQGFLNILNYHDANFEKRLMAFTNGEGVDVIFDPVGAAAWQNNLDYLKNNGVHINCARNTGALVQIDLAKLFSKQIAIYGAKTGSRHDLFSVLNKLIEHNNKPIIDKVFAFSEAKDALNYLKTSKQIGKVVIKHDECRDEKRI